MEVLGEIGILDFCYDQYILISHTERNIKMSIKVFI